MQWTNSCASPCARKKDGTRSLPGFLAEIESLELSIKRDMESAADAVRVMTVHAAKGLEAKIVFLPDTCSSPRPQHDAKIHRLDGGAGPHDSSPGRRARTTIPRPSPAPARRHATRLRTNIAVCFMWR